MSPSRWKFKETSKAVKRARLNLDIAKNTNPRAKTVYRKKNKEDHSIGSQGSQINPLKCMKFWMMQKQRLMSWWHIFFGSMQTMKHASPCTRLWWPRLAPYPEKTSSLRHTSLKDVILGSIFWNVWYSPPECVCKKWHHQHVEEAKEGSNDAIFVHIKQQKNSLKANPSTKWLVRLGDADLYHGCFECALPNDRGSMTLMGNLLYSAQINYTCNSMHAT